MSAYPDPTAPGSGKGFYVAVALILAGAGAAAIFSASPAVPAPETVPAPQSAVSASQQPRASSAPRVSRPAAPSQAQRPSAPAVSRPEAETQGAAASVPDLPVGGEPETPVPVRVVLTLPVEGEVIANFSAGELVKNTTLGDWRTHNGVDIRCEQGDAVRAAAAGTVTAVANDPLWGMTVTLAHENGLVTRCCGLAADIAVAEGEQVAAGAVLGSVAAVPAESLLPDHLHFEVLENDAYADPLSYLE